MAFLLPRVWAQLRWSWEKRFEPRMTQQHYPFLCWDGAKIPRRAEWAASPWGGKWGPGKNQDQNPTLTLLPSVSTWEGQKGLSSLVPSLGILAASTCAPGQRAVPWGVGALGPWLTLQGFWACRAPQPFHPWAGGQGLPKKAGWGQASQGGSQSLPPPQLGWAPGPRPHQDATLPPSPGRDNSVTEAQINFACPRP